ncbi:MAG: head decoration protein [Planctomycetota bacterium]
MTYRIGLGATESADPSEIRFTDHGRESTVAVVLDAAARDSGNSPETTLRKGLVLGKVTASGKYKEYDGGASDGTETARAILADEVDLLDESGTAVDTEGVGAFRGDFVASALIGLDADAKTDLAQCAFDEDL